MFVEINFTHLQKLFTFPTVSPNVVVLEHNHGGQVHAVLVSAADLGNGEETKKS